MKVYKHTNPNVKRKLHVPDVQPDAMGNVPVIHVRQDGECTWRLLSTHSAEWVLDEDVYDHRDVKPARQLSRTELEDIVNDVRTTLDQGTLLHSSIDRSHVPVWSSLKPLMGEEWLERNRVKLGIGWTG